MEQIHGFDFVRLQFDENGKLLNAPQFEELKQKAAQATDAIFIAHGFRNDENDATGLYTRFLETFRQHVDGPFHASIGSRKFVVAGVYWPSKKFPEDVKFDGSTASIGDDLVEKEAVRQKLVDMRDTMAKAEQKPKIDQAIQMLDQLEDNPEKQNEFVNLVLSLLDGTELDPTEGVDKVRAKEGSELLDSLAIPIRNPVVEDNDEGGAASVGDIFVPGDEGGSVQGIGSFFGSVFGRVGQFLNLTTWYLMKNRSGVVGATGVAKAVRDLKQSKQAIRIHLVGHSLGGRLMAGCAKSLAQAPMLRPDSLTLLEAAFSHYGFSSNNGKGQAGFFRSVVDQKVVIGPFIATFSAQDDVVGKVYAIASRLAGDNTEAIGDKDDPFGGIGRNGAQKCEVAISDILHKVGTPYTFTADKILGLDGSGGLIQNHGDVTNSTVTYAFASAVAAT